MDRRSSKIINCLSNRLLKLEKEKVDYVNTVDENLITDNNIINLQKNTIVENQKFENMTLKADNVDNINLNNNVFKNCRLLFKNVNNLSIKQ